MKTRMMLLFTLAAAVAAAAVAFTKLAGRQPQEAAAPPAPATVEPRATVARVERDDRRADLRSYALEGRLAELERAREQERAEAAAGAEPPPTADEERAIFERHLAAHDQQPLDAPWAASTSALIAADLGRAVADSAAKLVKVDCRSTSCTATLDWPSHEAVVAQYATLFGRAMRANCTIHILVPPSAPAPAAAMRTSAFFDCAGWREAGSQPLLAGGPVADER